MNTQTSSKMRLWLFVFLLSVFPLNLWAEEVRQVEEGGILKLVDGRMISLAGLEVTSEGERLLAVLLMGKEVRLEILETEVVPKKPLHALVFVKTTELQLPDLDLDKIHEDELLVNLTLLQMGAAQMRAPERLKKKRQEEFEKAQNTARETGQGLWSYEDTVLQKKSSN